MADPTRLILIGTVHRDPLGEEHLAALLEKLQPAAVTVEMSPAAAGYRQSRGPALLLRLQRILDRLAREEGYVRTELEEHPAVVDIRSLLTFPFEYRAALDYAERSGAPLELIDLPEISLRKLRRVEGDLITYRNLRTLVRLEGESLGRQEDYSLARALVLGRAMPEVVRDFLQRRRGAEGIGPRDAAMAEAIRRRLARLPRGRLAHIGGWVHLLDDPQGQTLYSRLRDLEPERLLLA